MREDTTTTSTTLAIRGCQLKDKVDKSLTSAISENIKQKLKKKLTPKIFGPGFPFR